MSDVVYMYNMWLVHTVQSNVYQQVRNVELFSISIVMMVVQVMW